jgi:hypothetical protein
MLDNVKGKGGALRKGDRPEKSGPSYLGGPSEDFKRAYRAWLSYYDQLEEFQQKVCKTRSRDGIAIPVGIEEMRLSNQKARLLRQELFEPLKLLNIPTDVECEARSLALREHERKWTKK